MQTSQTKLNIFLLMYSVSLALFNCIPAYLVSVSSFLGAINLAQHKDPGISLLHVLKFALLHLLHVISTSFNLCVTCSVHVLLIVRSMVSTNFFLGVMVYAANKARV